MQPRSIPLALLLLGAAALLLPGCGALSRGQVSAAQTFATRTQATCREARGLLTDARVLWQDIQALAPPPRNTGGSFSVERLAQLERLYERNEILGRRLARADAALRVLEAYAANMQLLSGGDVSATVALEGSLPLVGNRLDTLLTQYKASSSMGGTPVGGLTGNLVSIFVTSSRTLQFAKNTKLLKRYIQIGDTLVDYLTVQLRDTLLQRYLQPAILDARLELGNNFKAFLQPYADGSYPRPDPYRQWEIDRLYLALAERLNQAEVQLAVTRNELTRTRIGHFALLINTQQRRKLGQRLSGMEFLIDDVSRASGSLRAF